MRVLQNMLVKFLRYLTNCYEQLATEILHLVKKRPFFTVKSTLFTYNIC